MKTSLLKKMRRRNRRRKWDKMKSMSADILRYTLEGMKEALVYTAKEIMRVIICMAIVWIPILLCIISGALKK